MQYQDIFSTEIKQRFENVGDKLYNLKYSFDLFTNYLEDETETTLNIRCLALILNNYFNIIKEEYNKLEEDLGVLL